MNQLTKPGVGTRFHRHHPYRGPLTQMRGSSSAPNLTFQRFDPTRTKMNLKLGSNGSQKQKLYKKRVPGVSGVYISQISVKTCSSCWRANLELPPGSFHLIASGFKGCLELRSLKERL